MSATLKSPVLMVVRWGGTPGMRLTGAGAALVLEADAFVGRWTMLVVSQQQQQKHSAQQEAQGSALCTAVEALSE